MPLLNLNRINQVAVAQEFHISVTPLGEDEYLVRIERVAPGVPLAEEQVKWPVEDWLVQARQLMNDPLLGVLQGNAAFAEDIFILPEWDEPASQSSLNLVALGQQLYNALFYGSLRDSWMMAQAIAQNQRQVLRLRLGLKGTRLPRLPWEVLHAGDRPLATGTDVIFSRYQLNAGRISQLQTYPSPSNQPLEILMVIAGPSDQESLELAEEASHLREELNSRSPNESPAINLTILEQPGRERLTQELEQGKYQVFHYAGHSNMGESGGDLYLVSSKTGLTETLNGDDLAGLLVNNGVQLAVFNSCRGAYTAVLDAPESSRERNLAEALVKRGIPAVLAMAERIPDEVALTLTRLLYRNLNQGYSIDLSLSRARQGLISAYGSNQLYWALPVLYLRPEFDGYLTNNREEPPWGEDLDELEDDDLSELKLPFTEDDADADDPSAFIKNLLEQLNSKSASSDSMGSNPDFNNQPKSDSDTADSGLVSNSPNAQPSPAPESTEPIPAVATPQALLSPSEGQLGSSAPAQQRRRAGSKSWGQKLRQIPGLWIGLGVTGILTIPLLSFWVFQNGGLQPDDVLTKTDPSAPSIPQSDASSKTVDVKTADTSKVTAVAIEQLRQGKFAEGQKSVEALLDRGAFPQAEAALAVVPKAKLDEAAIYFLRGRLAWQSIQTGNKDYSLDDVRRYWEQARKKQPKSSRYLTALGFAYYAEGNYSRSNQAWLDALSVKEKAKGTADIAGSTAKTDELNTYAGLALGLRQYAQKQPANKRASLLSKSIKLRQKVLADDPVNFQPENLGKNWLWSEKAIKDWRSLLAASK